MDFKKILFLLTFVSIFSCSEDEDLVVARNLQEYIAQNSAIEEDAVIAFAANAEANTSLSYIFYAPEEGASDIRYYELTDSTLDQNNYENYRRQSLTSESVFDDKLVRFSRSGATESWCLVTFKIEGVLRISAPIKLNNISKSTAYTDEVSINYKTTTEPNFTWDDGTIKENIKYFQVLSNNENEFISGTFTENKFFQFYDESNVILNINTATPETLVEDEIYNFSMFGISEDNWVNLIINEQFIPRNLEEYIATNTETIPDGVLAFAGNANGNKEVTYIYFYPVEGAFNYRYYETEDTNVVPTEYANYKRKNLTEVIQFGGKFRRFSNDSSDEVYCLVTYILDGKLYISEPIRTKNLTEETEWTTDIEPTYPETLKPRFTWTDANSTDTETYFQVFTQSDDTFLSGTFTTEKTFQYYNEANVIVAQNIHSSTPAALVLDTDYKFFLYGLSSDNWINLVIQKSFIVQ